MSTDITGILSLKSDIKELHYNIDKLRQEIAEKEKRIKETCPHPTYTTKHVEDEYGDTIGWTRICSLCGEYLEK